MTNKATFAFVRKLILSDENDRLDGISQSKAIDDQYGNEKEHRPVSENIYTHSLIQSVNNKEIVQSNAEGKELEDYIEEPIVNRDNIYH